jgi:nucleoside-diphosphate-sugar epimerase
VFVTGATSPVGFRVVERLSQQGWKLCCLLRSARTERALFNFGATSVVRGTCEAPSAWEHTLEGVPTLLHLAPVTVARGPAEAAARRGVERFIALSSTRGLSKFPDPLAEAVREGEAYLAASTLNFTMLRSAMMYGARQDANIDRVAQWIDAHRWIPLIDNGKARIQPIHVDDVANAIVRTLERPTETERSRFILAGSEPLSWREMVETLADIKHRSIREISIPGRPARLSARALARVSSRFRTIKGVLERLEEDRVYDITRTLVALGDWTPMCFRDGAERTYGKFV